MPFRVLAQRLEKRLQMIELYKGLRRGRERRGWKKKLLATLRQAAQDMEEVSTDVSSPLGRGGIGW